MNRTVDGELITLAEAAVILGVGADYIRRLIRRGHLAEAGRRPSVSKRFAILVRRADVEQMSSEGWPGRRPPRSR